MGSTDVLNIHKNEKNIRKIEDIIDIQKANGTFNKVKFNLQTECKDTENLTNSLDSGLSKKRNNKKCKKSRTKYQNGLLPEIVWPSDSDITVLRMKLCPTNADIKDDKRIVLGDGLHVPDNCSMINLATLMLEQPSKHLNYEQLIPLSSWVTDKKKDDIISKTECNGIISLERNGSRESTKSKWARFLRLYFCPCCSCLYKLEEMNDDPLF